MANAIGSTTKKGNKMFMRTRFSHLREGELRTEIELALAKKRQDDYEELLKEVLQRHINKPKG